MATGQTYKGKNLRVSANGKTLFHSTECSMNSSLAFSEIATKDTNGVISSPEEITWTLTTSALVADKVAMSAQNDFRDLISLHLGKTKMNLQFTTDVVGDFVITGDAFIESFDITAAVGDIANGSFNFKGDGEYTIASVV